MKVHKFVKWDVPELSKLEDSTIYKAIEAAEEETGVLRYGELYSA